MIVNEIKGGYSQRLIRIDLSNERINEESLDSTLLRNYLGGTCLGIKYLYDEVNPLVNWNSPQNIVFIGSGPLGGTRVPGCGAFSTVTKGAFNNGVASTQANGFLGAYLKFSGIDAILIQGAATHWTYIYCHDGTAEIKDAEHLAGRDTWETEEVIKKELGTNESGLSVYSIGPAGENLVNFAGVIGDRGHSASHNGVGAVWGSKKLKAIAVAKGSGGVELADSADMARVIKELNDNWKKHRIYQWGTSMGLINHMNMGSLPVRNYTTNVFPEYPKFDGQYIRSRFKIKNRPCYACSSRHYEMITVTEGPYAEYYGKEPEYEQWATWGPQIGQTDPGAAVVLSNEADRLGVDCNESGWVIGWVMECYEKGILSAKDLDGLEMTWGNVAATRALLKNIAYRRGFGDLLAEGVKRAAEHVGRAALECAVYTMKPNTPRTHDHRGRWVELLDTCVSNTGTMENSPGFINDLTNYDLPQKPDLFSWQQQAEVEAKTKGSLYFMDSLVVCAFCVIGNLPLLAEAVSAATGWNFDFKEALNVGRRGVNLARIYNIQVGHKSDAEKPSARYFSTPVDGPAKGKAISPRFNDMLRHYYRLMGWNPDTGEPLKETLESLGLTYPKDIGSKTS